MRGERAPRPLALGSLVAVAVGASGAVALLAALVAFQGSAGQGYDLRAYLDASERIVDGVSPYVPSTVAGPFRPGPFGLYLYPPPLAVALLPLVGLEASTANTVWLLLRVGCLVAACAVMPVSRPVRIAAFGVACLSYPVLVDLNLGNVSVVVLALTAAAWRAGDTALGGVAVGVAALMRPPIAIVLLPPLVRRRPAQLVAAGVTGVVALLATLPFVGIRGWLDYAAVMRNVGGYTGVPRNADMSSAIALMRLPEPLPAIAFVSVAAVAVAAVAIAMRRDPETAFVVSVGASLLLAPLLWVHYLTLLVIPAAFLAARGRPWALALPLLGWLPEPLLPLAAVAATILPLVPGPREETATPVAAPFPA